MKYVSLFAGIGGFDLALNRLGHECVYANEWDKYATQIYNKSINGEKNRGSETTSQNGSGEGYEKPQGLNAKRRQPSKHTNRGSTGQEQVVDTRDIRTVPTTDIPDHDLLVGGFPCQAFSIAGKRRGFDDTRGTLFFEIARILKDKNPKYFILENVKGLLSHDNGFTFKTIISTLTELGYDLEWQVLNSKNFGVPQNRERVFIVGHIRGQPRPKVFPIGVSSGTNSELVYHQKADREIARVYDSKGIAPTLHLKTGGWQEPKIATTLMARDYKGVGNQEQIRRLTPTECERLQGFPDGWTEGISDTQRYKCLGNAVTVNVVYEVARRLTLSKFNLKSKSGGIK